MTADKNGNDDNDDNDANDKYDLNQYKEEETKRQIR